MKNGIRLLAILALLLLFVVGCAGSSEDENDIDGDNEAEDTEGDSEADGDSVADGDDLSDGDESEDFAMTAFSFEAISAVGVIDDTLNTVAVSVPFSTDVGLLAATFTVTGGATVSVNGVEQASGETVNDFSIPVVYTLTSGESTRDYTVTVTVEAAENNDEHNDMLGNLGVDTDLGDLQDPNGEDVSNDYNPFSRKIKTLFRKAEIYEAGVAIDGKKELVFDDQTATFNQLLTTAVDYAWAGNPKKAVSGDFDGDGIEEVATAIVNMVTWDLEIRVVQDSQENFTTFTSAVTQLGDLSEAFSTTQSKYWSVDAASGDLDGDSKAELLVTVKDSLYIIDDIDTEPVLVDGATYTGATKEQYVRVDAGDLDVDGKDEFVVTDGQWDSNGTAEYYIYDGAVENQLATGQVAVEIDTNNHVLFTADPIIGDFDGDKLLEIAFAGDEGGDHNNSVMLMDDSKQVTPFQFLPIYLTDDNEDDDRLPATAAMDLNGDAVYELLVEEDILLVEAGEFTRPYENNPLSRIFYGSITIGDVTGDYLDDIVMIKNDWGAGIYIYGLNSSHAFAELGRIPSLSDNTFVSICTVNLDMDSAIVKYETKELLFTKPDIVAVLSCPPYHIEANQNLDNTSTTFGRTEGEEVVKEQSVGFSVGFSFGYEYTAPFGIAHASVKTTVESVFDWTSSRSTEIETSIAYHSGAGEDKVIFSTVPFDVYYYTVLSAPDAAQVGETISINIPRDPQVMSVDREFYNRNNGDAVDITAEAMGHVIGDVSSYPTAAMKDAALEDGGLQSEVATIGAGAGSVELGISKTEGQGSGTEFDLSIKVEAEFGAGGVTAGVSAGFEYGYSYDVTNTESTFYAGEIGDIPSDIYTSDLMYQFGLYTYEKNYMGQRFVMVDYWVE